MTPFKLFEKGFWLNSISSGYQDLDNIIGGWQRGDLNLIAAPPRMGKTAFALSMLQNNLLLGSMSGIWFSSFLSKNQFTNMFISHYAEIQIEEITQGKIDHKLFTDINEIFKTHDFYFYENPNLNTKK